MAIIKFADIIGDASGRVAGFTIARNAHATFIRPWRPASNPKTKTQGAHRARYPRIAAAWSALSQIQRNAYNTWAADSDNFVLNRFADLVPLSGWQVFLRQSQNLLLCALPLPTAPPATALPTAPTISWIAARVYAGAVNYDRAYFAAGTFAAHYAVLTAAFTHSPAVTTTYTGFRFMKTSAPIAYDWITFTANVTATFGLQVIGSLVHLRAARITSDGLRGAYSQLSTPVLNFT